MWWLTHVGMPGARSTGLLSRSPSRSRGEKDTVSIYVGECPYFQSDRSARMRATVEWCHDVMHSGPRMAHD